MNKPTADQSYSIYKAAGLIIQNRTVLATRTKGKNIFIQPGGKLEKDESEIDALIRELREELGIHITEADVEKIDDYYAEAAGMPGQRLKLAAYLIKSYRGEITPHNEVEEIRYFNSQPPEDVEMASIFQHDILPILKARDLID